MLFICRAFLVKMAQTVFTSVTGNARMNTYVGTCIAANLLDWLTFVTKIVIREFCMTTTALFAELAGRFSLWPQLRNRPWKAFGESSMLRVLHLTAALLSAGGMHNFSPRRLRDHSLLLVRSAVKLEMAWIWARDYDWFVHVPCLVSVLVFFISRTSMNDRTDMNT